MKKSRSMRLASALLVLTLLSTCMISGTFAKYTTQASASDTAKVAKWGVTVVASNALFEENYTTDDTVETFSYTGVYSVDAKDDTDVIAPGTKGSMTFSIDGTPEVAVNVKVEFDKTEGTDLKMITLPAGIYKDYTKATYAEGETVAAYNGTFTLTANYYPVLWTLKRADTSSATKTVVTNMENVTLQDVENYFDTLSVNYDPNTDLGKTFGYYELSWEWPYETEGKDAADTYLGNVIAATPTDIDTTGVLTTEAFSLDITVTQID